MGWPLSGSWDGASLNDLPEICAALAVAVNERRQEMYKMSSATGSATLIDWLGTGAWPVAADFEGVVLDAAGLGTFASSLSSSIATLFSLHSGKWMKSYTLSEAGGDQWASVAAMLTDAGHAQSSIGTPVRATDLGFWLRCKDVLNRMVYFKKNFTGYTTSPNAPTRSRVWQNSSPLDPDRPYSGSTLASLMSSAFGDKDYESSSEYEAKTEISWIELNSGFPDFIITYAGTARAFWPGGWTLTWVAQEPDADWISSYVARCSVGFSEGDPYDFPDGSGTIDTEVELTFGGNTFTVGPGFSQNLGTISNAPMWGTMSIGMTGYSSFDNYVDPSVMSAMICLDLTSILADQ